MAGGDVRIITHGPLWNGRADAAVRAWMGETKRDLADQGAAIVKSKAAKFNRSGRGGSGRAAAAVGVIYGQQPAFVGRSDKGAVWWPWLEGTSKRNFTTRFKGYHPFRLAKNITQKRARELAKAKLAEYIGQMGDT